MDNGIWVYDKDGIFCDVQPCDIGNRKRFQVRCQHQVSRFECTGFTNCHIKTFDQARAIAEAYVKEVI